MLRINGKDSSKITVAAALMFNLTPTTIPKPIFFLNI